MKKLLFFCLTCFALILSTELSLAATTYDWIGTTANWKTPSNWKVGSTVQSTNYPGKASNDIAQIGVVAISGSFAPDIPTGTAISLATVKMGVLGSTYTSLTVDGTGSLTLSGAFTFTGGSTASATLAGTGTISATSLAITASGTSASYTLTLSSSITALNLSSTLALTTVRSGTKYGDATFDLTGGTTSVTGAVTTTNANSGNTSTISISSGATLKLANTTAFSGLSSTGTNTLTFSSGSTINYSGTTAQTVYAAITHSSLSGGVTYSNLTLSGSAIKTVPSGTLTVDGNFTNSLATTSSNKLDLTTNSIPVVFGGTAQTIDCGTGLGTTFKNITFSGSGIKTVSSGIMNITGNFTNSLTTSGSNYADFITNSTPVNFTGTAQTLAGGGGTGTLFENITFSGGGTKTMSSGTFGVAPTGVLTLSGSSTLAAGSLLTLNSDATGSATVAAIPSGSSVTGNVHVERFITGGTLTERGYRLMSSAVNAATGVYNLDFLKATGSLLTGGGGTTNGWDALGNPTLYLYRDDETPDNSSFTVGNYRAINKINNTNTYNLTTIDGTFDMPVGTGFLYFFRGNTGTLTTTVPSDVTFSATGALNQGQITYTYWPTGTSGVDYTAATGNSAVEGFNLAGNPYPSSIDWHTNFGNNTATTGICCSTGLDNTIYIYNPVSKVYATYLNTSATTGTAANGGSNIIPQGQGFFVHATTTGASLIFNESAKVSQQPATLLLDAATPPVDQQLRLELAKDSVNKEETVLVFNNDAHAAYIEGEDALYFPSTGEVSLSNMTSNNKALAINQLPFPAQRRTIPLNVSVASPGTYQFNLTDITNIPAIFDIWLKDALLKDSVDIKNNPAYSFAVAGDTIGTGSRFSLVISPDPALAVQLLSFTGTKEATDVKLAWTAKNEDNYTQYTLQRSTDGGNTFIALDSLTSANLGTYTDLDPNPVTGQNKYRLKQVDINGVVSYSVVVTIMYSPVSNNIGANIVSVYPNPASTTLNLTIKADATATTTASYKITITSSAGIVIKTATSTQPNWQNDVSNLYPGTYFVQVTNAQNNTIVGRSTFIKL